MSVESVICVLWYYC